MVDNCAKCGRKVPEDSVYCLYCGHGIKPSARSNQVSGGGALMAGAALASLIHFAISLIALLNIYNWYPAIVAQIWFFYDQMLTAFSLTGLLSGLTAAMFSLARKGYKRTMISAVLCTLSCGGAWITAMIIPHSSMVHSFLYYFLPLLTPSLIGTVLILSRKMEFDST